MIALEVVQAHRPGFYEHFVREMEPAVPYLAMVGLVYLAVFFVGDSLVWVLANGDRVPFALRALVVVSAVVMAARRGAKREVAVTRSTDTDWEEPAPQHRAHAHQRAVLTHRGDEYNAAATGEPVAPSRELHGCQPVSPVSLRQAQRYTPVRKGWLTCEEMLVQLSIALLAPGFAADFGWALTAVVVCCDLAWCVLWAGAVRPLLAARNSWVEIRPDALAVADWRGRMRVVPCERVQGATVHVEPAAIHVRVSILSDAGSRKSEMRLYGLADTDARAVASTICAMADTGA